MAIRIYALAKQLKLDSKTLVGVCKQAGVSGKGSALASLSDEEVEKIKAHLSGGGVAKGDVEVPDSHRSRPTAFGRLSSKSEAGPINREDYIAPAGANSKEIRVMNDLPTKRVEPAPKDQETEKKQVATPEEEVALELPESSDSMEETSEHQPPTEELPSGLDVPQRPKAPILSKKPEFLGEKPGGLGKNDKNGKLEKIGPSIKLAPIPTLQQTVQQKKSEGPAPQKPDIKLPADAIRASKAGGKPLSEHLKKSEKKRKDQSRDVGAKKSPKKRFGSGETEKSPKLEELTGHGSGRRPLGKGDQQGDRATLGGREQRQLKRKRTSARQRKVGNQEERAPTKWRSARFKRTGTNTAAPRKSKVVLQLPCTVKTFSEAVGVSVANVLGKLLGLGAGTGMNINVSLEPDIAELLAAELGVDVDIRRPVSLERKLLADLDIEDDPDSLEPRLPVVTFLGHVDHGKTSLLDRVIGIDVVSGEKGGITQHIRAYRVQTDSGEIAFVDTPGHEAFTEMRARGANVTDIAVLVIAADDGIMPQTEEAISHARAADVPIVIALNKIDLPGVDVDRVFQQLAANELLPTEWGGDVEVVKTSAITGEGVNELIETLLTVAELYELKANPNRAAVGTCLESELHEGRGVVAKVLVQKGTLRVGDVIVCGSSFGRVKTMYDTLVTHKEHETVGPSMPVNLTGLDEAPAAGDRLHVLPDIGQAREIAEQRADVARAETLTGGMKAHVTLENLFERLDETEVQVLNIILRADVRGSIEAIQKEMTKLDHPEVQIKILQAAVGGITEADVHLADASDAVIIGFNVVPDEGARLLADRKGVQIRRYDIIYQVTEDLQSALEGMLKPEKREQELGRALVQRTFQISRLGTIAGCRVLAGSMQRDSKIRVIRDSRIIGVYPLESLKREKDDAKEVREGLECGIRLRGFNDLKEGDILEAYRVEEIARTF